MNCCIRYLCVVCLASPAFAPGLLADTPNADQAQAKLAEVQSRIAALTSRLARELQDRDALAARVREADLTITAQRRKLESLRAAQAAAERRRAELHSEEARNQTALDAQHAALAAQVRAAYMIGRQEPLKLLLNQGDPASAGRLLTLYGYFARARVAKIEEIRAQVTRMQALLAEEDRVGATLRQLAADAAHGMEDLKRARAARASALAGVTQQVSSGAVELGRLKREEQAEEALVADLARVLQDFPVDAQQSFDGLRGRLPWPVTGRMSARLQDTREGASGVRANGVLIDAPRGAKVRAPYFGRVVYADWLQGMGLLLIIGHSGNYMTLYGHAEVLYKSVGDWVAPGDVIAALSDSGGAAPQLYFEIRDGRKAVDPKLWLKATP